MCRGRQGKEGKTGEGQVLTQDCIVCENEGVIYCINTSLQTEKFTKKELREMLDDIIETKLRGGKL